MFLAAFSALILTVCRPVLVNFRYRSSTLIRSRTDGRTHVATPRLENLITMHQWTRPSWPTRYVPMRVRYIYDSGAVAFPPPFSLESSSKLTFVRLHRPPDSDTNRKGFGAGEIFRVVNARGGIRMKVISFSFSFSWILRTIMILYSRHACISMYVCHLD